MTRFLIALLTATAITGAVAPDSFAADAGGSNGFPEAGDWLIRGRLIGVIPDEESRVSPIGGEARFSNEVVPEVDFSYFFTKNIAAELILATAKHEADVKNSVAGPSVDVGSAWVLPPTLTLQYHFTNFEGFKPYVGAGINYTFYLNEDPGSQQSLNMDDSFGWALQAGVDVPINDRWGWNFDVKRLFVDADGSWNGGGITADIDLDPWIVGTGITYRF